MYLPIHYSYSLFSINYNGWEEKVSIIRFILMVMYLLNGSLAVKKISSFTITTRVTDVVVIL